MVFRAVLLHTAMAQSGKPLNANGVDVAHSYGENSALENLKWIFREF